MYLILLLSQNKYFPPTTYVVSVGMIQTLRSGAMNGGKPETQQPVKIEA